MAHYAILDENNIVTAVIVGKDENEDNIDWEQYYGGKRTSYNTHGGIHYDENNEPSINQSKSFRKNFASIGDFYDVVKDAFINPRPQYRNCQFDEVSCQWICQLDDDEV